MQTAEIVHIIQDAAATHSSAKSSDKASVIEACSSLIESLEQPEQKKANLLFFVRPSALFWVGNWSDSCMSASEGSVTSSRYQYASIRCEG